MLKGINWIGVLVAAVVSYGIGAFWYSVAFGAQWMALSGMSEADIAATSSMSYLYGALQTLIVSFGIGWLVARTGMTTLRAGATAGLWACLFFALATYSLRYIYGNDNLGLIGIDAPYMVLQYVLSGAIIGGLKLGTKAAA